jgi:hypothetical protein
MLKQLSPLILNVIKFADRFNIQFTRHHNLMTIFFLPKFQIFGFRTDNKFSHNQLFIIRSAQFANSDVMQIFHHSLFQTIEQQKTKDKRI